MILQIDDFNLFINKEKIINNLSISLKSNEILGIFCKSGAGKTSLLNYIAGIIHENENYYVEGKKSIKENVKISYAFQDSRFIEEISILKNLLICLNKKNDSNNQLASAILKQVNLIDKANEKPSKLSGGQLQRAGVARALLVPFDLVLLDEPFAFQDSQNKEILINLISDKVVNSQKAAIIVSHNIEDLQKLTNKIISF